MYKTRSQIVENARRWYSLAIAYQTRAIKLTNGICSPKDYPIEVFMCYRGYARCIQMYDACWIILDRMNIKYEKEKAKANQMAEVDLKFVSYIAALVALLILGLFSGEIFESLVRLSLHI